MTTNTKVAAGGFNMQEYYQRSLVEAFGGLGVFVSDERPSNDMPMLDTKMVASESAADLLNKERKASKPTKTLASDDVFG